MKAPMLLALRSIDIDGASSRTGDADAGVRRHGDLAELIFLRRSPEAKLHEHHRQFRGRDGVWLRAHFA